MGRPRRPLVLVAVAVCIGLLAYPGLAPEQGQGGGGASDAPTRLAQSLNERIVSLPRPLPLPRITPALYRTTGTAGVALTFDDGPDPYWTPRYLALLRQHNVKATFCILGSRARAHPRLVRQIATDGHALCNHTTWHDLRLRKRSARHVAADLRYTSSLIAKASGARPKLFRAPGGNWSPTVIATARQQGMASLHWDVDPQDWRRPHPYQLVVSVRKNTRRGSIVLLHDSGGDRASTYTALVTLLPDLRRRFQLVAL